MDSNKRVFHVSKTGNLTKLEPRVSTHGKAYVYGTTNLAVGLLFGAHGHGDLDGIYGINQETGKPFFYEAYPGAFRERFKGENPSDRRECTIYEVDPSTFQEGKTAFSGEVVSEQPVEITKATHVSDLYEILDNLIQSGEIEFKPYSKDKEYQDMIRAHIEKRFESFNVLRDRQSLLFCLKKYPNIVLDYILKKLKNKVTRKNSEKRDPEPEHKEAETQTNPEQKEPEPGDE